MIRPLLTVVTLLLSVPYASADGWKDDPAWHDGLVEKATYAANRVIYGKPRQYTAVVFTNKEQHDLKTLTKADGSKETVEVFKHNQVEVVPTPNYDYKFEATTHLTVDGLELTRLDVASQEFCGTSFKQYLRRPGEGVIDYWGFSYMPEAGRVAAKIPAEGRLVVPADGLALWLRDFDFAARRTVQFRLLPTQKSNRATPHAAVPAEARYAGEDGDAHKVEVIASGQLLGTYWMAKDRLHVMTRYRGADGQTYELQKQERVDYWTIRGE